MEWLAMGATLVSGLVAAGSSFADRGAAADEWRRFWVPDQQRRIDAGAVIAHFVSGVLVALFAIAVSWFPAGESPWWKWTLNALVYAVVAEAAIRLEYDIELGVPGQSLLRKALRGAARRGDASAAAAVKRLIREAHTEALWAKVFELVEVAYGTTGGKDYELLKDSVEEVGQILLGGKGAGDRQALARAQAALARTAQQLFIAEKRTIDGFASVHEAKAALTAAPQEATPSPSGAPREERRRKAQDRRSGEDRRQTIDLRDARTERRSLVERRSGGDRRS